MGNECEMRSACVLVEIAVTASFKVANSSAESAPNTPIFRRSVTDVMAVPSVTTAINHIAFEGSDGRVVPL